MACEPGELYTKTTHKGSAELVSGLKTLKTPFLLQPGRRWGGPENDAGDAVFIDFIDQPRDVQGQRIGNGGLVPELGKIKRRFDVAPFQPFAHLHHKGMRKIIRESVAFVFFGIPHADDPGSDGELQIIAIGLGGKQANSSFNPLIGRTQTINTGIDSNSAGVRRMKFADQQLGETKDNLIMQNALESLPPVQHTYRPERELINVSISAVGF
ncbi:MAG: hypothetical protein P4M15_09305 [Alphaproteobacteria bacterium]|nr:hypothetical protein [Alphaproteobacteria bacterium]